MLRLRWRASADLQLTPSRRTPCFETLAQAYLGGRFLFWARWMTNTIAVVLGGFLIAAIAIDIALFGDVHMIFLGKRMLELIDWIAFWR